MGGITNNGGIAAKGIAVGLFSATVNGNLTNTNTIESTVRQNPPS